MISASDATTLGFVLGFVLDCGWKGENVVRKCWIFLDNQNILIKIMHINGQPKYYKYYWATKQMPIGTGQKYNKDKIWQPKGDEPSHN